MAYGIKAGYNHRLEPQYFDDVLPDSTEWQADVYRLAAELARKAGVKTLVDIGCGRGGKLAPYTNEFSVIGIDYGANIDACKAAYPAGRWESIDVNKQPIENFPESVVICADVIEHLPTPDALISTFHNACKTAKYVLVSTPDRMRVYGHDHNGPSGNPYHVREWTNEELENWLRSEGLPVRWVGWTVSNDHRPDQVWTSLVILSNTETVSDLPARYEPANRTKPARAVSRDGRLKVWMTPTPSEASRDTTNSIHQIVLRLAKHLPDYGVDLVEYPDNADLLVAHAGQGSPVPVDVSHYHGLYPTAMGMDSHGYFQINSNVIRNLKAARAVTAPSNWIADVLRRDMHLSPHIIGWGVDTDEWTPGENLGYVLWNKARVDVVSDPAPMQALAERAKHIPFVTTFGTEGENVKVIGRQTHEDMKRIVRGARVYLATVTETFGIGTIEAMACGVPVLGFRHGGTADIVEHGVTGYLAEPGDIDGLLQGLEYCIKYREILGENAREAAKRYTWDNLAKQFAAIYRDVLKPRVGAKCSVIIPCHNYGRYVAEAIESVLAQQANFEYECIVVLDRCTDDSAEVVARYADRGVIALTVDNGNLSMTRNSGIEAATGEYVCCLDADDRIGSPLFLQTLSDALDTDRTLGIAFTSIRVMDSEGKLGHLNAWPNGYDFDKQAMRMNQVPSCCLFRKEAWRRVGGFKPHFVYAQDAEFWLQVGAIGYGGKHVVHDGWFEYRLHNQSQSMAHRTGEVPEPDWTEWYPWTRDGQRPFAADGRAPYGSWPVRFYLKPDVSVVIPVGRGHEINLIDALHSVEGQSHRFWECIVVNDTGKPLDLTGFPWAKVINTKGSIGAGAARNLGVKQANAPFITFLDADDMLKPRFLELTLKTYRQNGKYVYTDYLTHNKQTNWQTHPTPEYGLEVIRDRPSIHAVTTLLPRKWFEDVGGFDESLPSFEDVDLYMKLFTKGYCGVRLPESLLIYNLNSGKRRQSSQSFEPKFKELLKKRYGAFMEGQTMCNCVQPPKGKAAVAPTPENAAEYAETYGDMVKIEFTWEYAPEGATTLRGAATRVNYGRRAKHDVFYVWQADLDNNPEMFTRLVDYTAPAIQATVVPPPPPPTVEEFAPVEGEVAVPDEPQIVSAPVPYADSPYNQRFDNFGIKGGDVKERVAELQKEEMQPKRKPSSRKRKAS